MASIDLSVLYWDASEATVFSERVWLTKDKPFRTYQNL